MPKPSEEDIKKLKVHAAKQRMLGKLPPASERVPTPADAKALDAANRLHTRNSWIIGCGCLLLALAVIATIIIAVQVFGG